MPESPLGLVYAVRAFAASVASKTRTISWVLQIQPWNPTIGVAGSSIHVLRSVHREISHGSLVRALCRPLHSRFNDHVPLHRFLSWKQCRA